MIRNALIAFGISFFSFATAPSVPANPEAAAVTVEKGSMKVTVGDYSGTARLAPHSADWSGSMSFGNASMVSIFKKDTLKIGDTSALMVGVSFNLDQGKGKEGEVQIRLHNQKHSYSSRLKLAEPRLTLTKLSVNGGNLVVEGVIEAKVFRIENYQANESQSLEVKVEFSAELPEA